MRKLIRNIKNESKEKRLKRKLVIRKKISGSELRPRICAIRSNKHLVVQVVDDSCGKTLFSVQTFGKNAPSGAANNVDGAKAVGSKVAELLKQRSVENAVFDRGGFKYTGVIASLADSIRNSGIKI